MSEQGQFNSNNSQEGNTSSSHKADHTNQSHNTAASSKPQPSLPQTNVQKIQQKKQAVLAFPYNKKLLKLAIYSKCQVSKSVKKYSSGDRCKK